MVRPKKEPRNDASNERLKLAQAKWRSPLAAGEASSGVGVINQSVNRLLLNETLWVVFGAGRAFIGAEDAREHIVNT